MPAHRQAGFQKQFNKIGKTIMKPSSHALAMLTEAYRNILQRDFILNQLGKFKGKAALLALPFALVGGLAFSGSAYAEVKTTVYDSAVSTSQATSATTAGSENTAAQYTASNSGGTVAGTYNGYGNTTNLTLTVESGKTVTTAYGGFKGVNQGNAEGYTLTITGSGTVAKAYGGYSDTGSANGNTVNISGGTFSHDDDASRRIFGGFSGGSGSASGNSVFISGGTFTGSGIICGGRVGTTGGTATDNKVYLNYSDASTPETDTLNLSGYSVIGGYVGSSAVNTSNSIYASGIVRVNSISGFNALTLNVSSVNLMENFSGSSSEGAEKAVIISTNSVDLSSRTLTLTSTDSELSGNYALIYSDAGVTEPSTVKVSGTFTEATYTVSKTSDSKLLYTNAKASATYTKEAETLSAANLSSAAIAVSQNSFSATEGMSSAVAAAAGTTNSSGVAAFGAVGGGSLTYKIGSHIDVDSFNATVGGAKLFDDINEGDALTVAAFIDMGIGHSRSHVINTSASSDNKVFGIGTGIKYQFACGAFADATARIGRAKAEFKGAYSRTGLKTEYDSKTTYYGFSLGGGYNFDLTQELTLSPYARYTFTRNGSDTVSLKGISKKLHFEAVEAHSVRTGLDGLYKLTDTFALKAGLAVEHTWDGDARSQLGGVNLATPSISGTSGIMDLGIRFTPSGAKGWDFEVGATGRVGDVHGVTGQIKALYVF